MKKNIILIFVFLLCSCAATGPKFTGLETAQEDKALVYILRPPAFTASARKVNISINDEEYIKLKNKGYTIARLTPGTYKFKQSSNYIVGDPAVLREVRTFEMEVKGGETYYIGFHADSAVGTPWVIPITQSDAVVFVPIAFEYGFGIIGDPLALEELKKCHYQEPGV